MTVTNNGRCHAGTVTNLFFSWLTFEVSGRRRQDAEPGPVKMYRVPSAPAWWPAVGARLREGLGVNLPLLEFDEDRA